ncbi:MAG: tRNA epoxyqueuosine(34) reductase QueG [Terriglobales bacterium]
MESARELGFEIAGVAAVEAFAELRRFPAWIETGQAGEMRYLARRTAAAGGPYLREDIRNAFPWARSVICCGLVYNTRQPKSVERDSSERGWISRYAWGDDYHGVLLEQLKALARRLRQEAQGGEDGEHIDQRVYVDTGPVLERVYAHHAGLGWLGKNTCLISQRHGSYFFLGTLVCSLEIEPDASAHAPVADRCGSCTRCIEACPTQALRPYEMDASRCIAYLNIELRGPIPEPLREAMGSNVLGCDICQDVCPWNRSATVTEMAAFQPRPGLVHPELEMLAGLDEAGYRELFRNSAIKRAKWAGLRRNVAVAMGNSGNSRFRERLQAWSESEDAVLREHAQWALQKLAEAENERREESSRNSPSNAKF